MSRHLLIRTCVLLAVTSLARSQYVDFFQNFNSFLQPFATTKARNDATKRPDTKHRQTNKQKIPIFFVDDVKLKDNPRNIDTSNFYTTTTKPRRKSTKATTTSIYNNVYTTHRPNINKEKKTLSNKIINNNNGDVNHEVIRSISNNNQPYNNVDNRVISNARLVNYNGYNDNQNGYNSYDNSETTSNNIYPYQGHNYNTNENKQTTQRTTTVAYYNPRQTTRKTTDYYNQRQPTRKTTDYYNSRQTTNVYDSERTTRRPINKATHSSQSGHNPLLHRPGVKPAAVDENKPPITNRPVTSTPVYDRPYESSYRPVNTRPPYETEKTRRPNTRPVNTRPPFETERPLSSGVVRPSDVVRPSGVSRPSGIVRPSDVVRPSGVVRPSSVTNRPSVSGTTAVNEDAEPNIEIGPDEDLMSDSEKRRLYNICEQKCDEYKSARIKKVVALPLAPNSQGVSVNVSSCAPSNVPLIIGGEVARIQQFPHMALVGWKNIQNGGHSWKCGGSLVSEQYILTAGHCTYHDKDYNVVSGPPHAVQLGSAIYNDRTATVVQISAIIRHPKYKLRRSYHDVALIKMMTTVTFSEKISPACLGVPPPVGDPVIATGWGKTEYGGDSSIELRKVSIPIWDMSECREIWGTSLKLPNGPMPDNQICAGERKGAKDTCQGDSGGPAQVQDGCLWRVVAITSVGRSCGAPETPALYARIPRAFIASQIYTNVKPGRDGNNQYGNDGITNKNSGSGNNNGGIRNNNRPNINNPFANSGMANVRPIQDNNGQNYDNSGRIQNNNGPYYSESQSSISDSRGVTNNYNNNNRNNNNNGNNPQNPRDNNNNNWSVQPDVTNNNRNNNQNNANNRYGNQNNGNLYDQSSFGDNGQIYRSTRTTTVGYNNQNNYGQTNYNNYGHNGYNNEQIQNSRNTETPTEMRRYENPTYSYSNNERIDNTHNDNRRIDNTYNGFNVNTPVANRPWWNV